MILFWVLKSSTSIEHLAFRGVVEGLDKSTLIMDEEIF